VTGAGPALGVTGDLDGHKLLRLERRLILKVYGIPLDGVDAALLGRFDVGTLNGAEHLR